MNNPLYRIYDTQEKRHRDDMFVKPNWHIFFIDDFADYKPIVERDRYIVEPLHIRFSWKAYKNDIIQLSDGRLLILWEYDYVLDDKDFTILWHAIKDVHIIEDHDRMIEEKEIKRQERHKCKECSQWYYSYNGEGDKPVCENWCNHPDGSYWYMCKRPSYCRCSQ